MADTIYTRTLARAAEAQGSTQALASLLRVPENTLLRWMSGRAQMPLRAFLKLIELLMQHEKSGAGQTSIAEQTNGERLTFRIGELLARCARCDDTQFLPTVLDGRERLTSELQCAACGQRVVHGDLLGRLAKDAVKNSRVMTAVRTRRQAGSRLRAMQKEADG